MPTVFKVGNIRFFFFSREESRVYIHVISPDGEAKYWLQPNIELAINQGFSQKQLNEIKNIIEEHKDECISAWQKFFNT